MEKVSKVGGVDEWLTDMLCTARVKFSRVRSTSEWVTFGRYASVIQLHFKEDIR